MTRIIGGTYEIIGEIGSGGGGKVFLARHRRLDKKIVVKADKRRITTRESLLRKEVDVLKELSIPHIPRVYDYFVENGIAYTVMDYIEGESLDRLLKRNEAFSQAQLIDWAEQLLEALKELHAPVHGDPPKGYVHSDIKPANLMRTPGNEIYLIDFNIALALGETRVIGASAGYASPEHYGLDFSSDGSLSRDASEKGDTDVLPGGTEVLEESGEAGSSSDNTHPNATTSGKRVVVPDVRSDIYSVGATLYHLLSGHRPAKEALKVIPLSRKEYNLQLVDIITKAMNPNPDLRFQTADEMLEAFYGLRRNDPGMRAWRRKRLVAGIAFPVLMAVGVGTAFVGLKRMQTSEKWLKLCEYARTSLEEGNVEEAVDSALAAMPESKSLLTPQEPAEAQRVLTEALGIYDLAGSYKSLGLVTLPSQLLGLELSQDSSKLICRYSGYAEVIDTQSLESLQTLPMAASALAEAKFLNDDVVIYAAEDGIRCVRISTGEELWNGREAIRIGISEDASVVAAVDLESSEAGIYDAAKGTVLQTVDFEDGYQSAAVSDLFADPENNLLSLSEDGRYLAVSFADGSLRLTDLENPDQTYRLLDSDSGYRHFEGGFSGQYFAFAASGENHSVFAVLDTESMEQTGGFETTEGTYSVQVDGNGIFIQSDNILVKIDPVTGDQQPLVTTAESIERYSTDGTNTMIVTDSAILCFDENAIQTGSYEKTGSRSYTALAGTTAAVGSLDSQEVRILTYEDFPETQCLTYDPTYEHSEARVSADGQTWMLFSYKKFWIFGADDSLISETEIPDADEVYDQQYRREGGDSYLEVIYYDGTVRCYDAADGSLLEESDKDPPDDSLDEEFTTEQYRIVSPLHGNPEIYEKESGKFVRELTEDAYLTYVTQVGEGYVLQFISSDGNCYGQLYDQNWEVIADLPYLCDVKDKILYFDYPSGDIRGSRILDREEIKEKAKEREVG